MKSKIKYFPIKLLVGFLIFTEFFFYLSPINYPPHAAIAVIIFFILCNFLLYQGYATGIRQYRNSTKQATVHMQNLHYIIIAALILKIPQFINGWNLNTLSPGVFIQHLRDAIVNPGDTYYERLQYSSTTIWTYIGMILSPLSLMGNVCAIYFWKHWSLKYKVLSMLLISLSILYWFGIGVRKGIIDILIMFAVLYIAANPDILQKGIKLRRTYLFLSLVAFGFIYYFIYSNLSRYGLTTNEIEEIEISRFGIKDFYLEYTTPSIYLPLSQIASYLCQGYYALSLAINDILEHGLFCFTYGFGNNLFTINVMEHLVPEWDILGQTYQGYLKEVYNIDPLINWHSIYLWLANDFTILGVFPLMYIWGKLFATAWMDLLTHRTIYAAPIVVLCAQETFYFFANNQVFSFSFISFFILYFLYRKNRIRIIKRI